MWSLDAALRYVPLAALHGGEHWLIERYPLVLYNAAAKDNLRAAEDRAW
jgi:CHAT domain-containing protein